MKYRKYNLAKWWALAFTVFIHLAVTGQNITDLEYYVDADSGYGKNTQVKITPAPDLNAVPFTFNFSSLSSGLHIIGIRSRDTKGAWSFDERWLFIKAGATASTSNIKQIKYYIDNDPGYDKETSFANFTQAQDVSNVSTGPIGIDTLSAGLHIIGVRSQNADGQWSFDERWLFMKKDTTADLPKIVKVEYYVDEDPGYGKAVPVTFTAATEVVNLSMSGKLSENDYNLHKMCVRSQDAKGAWSFDQCWLYSGNVLPVQSLKFTATGEKDRVKIFWSTATETNSKQFLIRRSLNGLDYETIATVPAIGNSTTAHNYFYNDYDAMSFKGKRVYYQIVQKDVDGRGVYTDIKIVLINSSLNYLRLAYNPVKNQAILRYEIGEDNQAIVRIIDASGKIVQSGKVQIKTGINQIPLQVSVLAKGIYTVEVINEKDIQHVKMIKE